MKVYTTTETDKFFESISNIDFGKQIITIIPDKWAEVVDINEPLEEKTMNNIRELIIENVDGLKPTVKDPFDVNMNELVLEGEKGKILLCELGTFFVDEYNKDLHELVYSY